MSIASSSLLESGTVAHRTLVPIRVLRATRVVPFFDDPAVFAVLPGRGTEDKFLGTRLLVHFRVWDKGEAVRRIASLALSFLSRPVRLNRYGETAYPPPCSY